MEMQQSCAKRPSFTYKVDSKASGGYEILFILFRAVCVVRFAGHKAENFDEKSSDQ